MARRSRPSCPAWDIIACSARARLYCGQSSIRPARCRSSRCVGRFRWSSSFMRSYGRESNRRYCGRYPPARPPAWMRCRIRYKKRTSPGSVSRSISSRSSSSSARQYSLLSFAACSRRWAGRYGLARILRCSSLLSVNVMVIFPSLGWRCRWIVGSVGKVVG